MKQVKLQKEQLLTFYQKKNIKTLWIKKPHLCAANLLTGHFR